MSEKHESELVWGVHEHIKRDAFPGGFAIEAHNPLTPLNDELRTNCFRAVTRAAALIQRHNPSIPVVMKWSSHNRKGIPDHAMIAARTGDSSATSIDFLGQIQGTHALRSTPPMNVLEGERNYSSHFTQNQWKDAFEGQTLRHTREESLITVGPIADVFEMYREGHKNGLNQYEGGGYRDLLELVAEHNLD